MEYVYRIFTADEAEELVTWYVLHCGEANYRSVMRHFSYPDSEENIGDDPYTTDFDCGFFAVNRWNPRLVDMLSALERDGSLQVDVYYDTPFCEEEEEEEDAVVVKTGNWIKEGF